MANRIMGITVEIGGDTTKLQTALTIMASLAQQESASLSQNVKLALLGKKIQRNVRSGSDYSSAEKSDILYYVYITLQ